MTRSEAVNKKKVLGSKKKRAASVQALLHARYPEPETHLVAHSAWELLIAVILSAQCTDARVNMVTPALFQAWPKPEDLAHASTADVEECIRSTGFFRNKTKNIIGAAQRIMTHYDGHVPDTMEALLTLPGVARKTANVVLWTAFGKNEGIAVDTHVGRIARRLGLATATTPEGIERELMTLFPQDQWGNVNHRLVWFGRHICSARKPLCGECELLPYCPQNGVS